MRDSITVKSVELNRKTKAGDTLDDTYYPIIGDCIRLTRTYSDGEQNTVKGRVVNIGPNGTAYARSGRALFVTTSSQLEAAEYESVLLETAETVDIKVNVGDTVSPETFALLPIGSIGEGYDSCRISVSIEVIITYVGFCYFDPDHKRIRSVLGNDYAINGPWQIDTVEVCYIPD